MGSQPVNSSKPNETNGGRPEINDETTLTGREAHATYWQLIARA